MKATTIYSAVAAMIQAEKLLLAATQVPYAEIIDLRKARAELEIALEMEELKVRVS